MLICATSANAMQYTFTTALTTPSSTEVLVAKESGDFINSFVLQYTIAGISTNVVVKAEGSLDNSNWFNLDDSGNNTTHTSDGTFQMHKENTPVTYLRFTMVSESGGTAATINVKYLGQ